MLSAKRINKFEILISWDEKPFPDTSYYRVERSLDQKKSYVLLADNLTDLFYVDTDAKEVPGAVYFYKVTAFSSSGATKILGEVSPSWQRSVGLYGMIESALSVHRDHLWSIAFKNYGEDVFILTKKRVGKRCVCYDPNSGVPSSDCVNCFGTGYLGGFNFYESKAIFYRSELRFREDQWGVGITQSPRVYLPPYPIVNPFDILVRKASLERFFVFPVEFVNIQISPLHQVVHIERIPLDSVYYKIKLVEKPGSQTGGKPPGGISEPGIKEMPRG